MQIMYIGSTPFFKGSEQNFERGGVGGSPVAKKRGVGKTDFSPAQASYPLFMD